MANEGVQAGGQSVQSLRSRRPAACSYHGLAEASYLKQLISEPSTSFFSLFNFFIVNINYYSSFFKFNNSIQTIATRN